MPFDKSKFLDDLVKAGNLSDEQRKVWEQALGIDSVHGYLDGYGLRQSDYSTKMNELDGLKKDYNQKIQDTITLQAQVTADKEKYGKPDPKLANELKAARASLSAMESKILGALQKSREQYGADSTDSYWKDMGLGTTPDEIIVKPTIPTEEKNEKTANEIDPRYLTMDTAQLMMEFMAYDYPMLTREYRDLTGSDFDYGDFRAKVKADGGKRSPAQIMQDEYKFTDLRSQKEQKRIDELIAKAKDEGYQKGRTETALNGGGGGEKPTTFVQGMMDDNKKFGVGDPNAPAPQSIDTKNAAIADLEKRIANRAA